MDDQPNAPVPTNPDDVQDKAVEVSQDMVNGQASEPSAPAVDMPAAPTDQSWIPEMPAAPTPDATSTDAPAPAPMTEPGTEEPAPETPVENTPESTPTAL